MNRTIVIASGGIDSITLAYSLVADGDDIIFLTFDYGQRHNKEIEAARYFAGLLKSEFILFDLQSFGQHLNNNSLTGHLDVHTGLYSRATMVNTVVPARNAVMLAIATGIAANRGIDKIAMGVHGGDHHIYPDCRPNFILEMQQALRSATNSNIRLYTPYVLKNKTYIIQQGHSLGVPYEQTWSCYNGGKIHCGQCGTCIERRGAFRHADIFDPTIYEA